MGIIRAHTGAIGCIGLKLARDHVSINVVPGVLVGYQGLRNLTCPYNFNLQVTDALAYLHDDVGIVHNDLKCSNILVFQFPEPDHYCSDGGEAPLTCSHCLCDPNGCGVLVKLADLGICANPAARRNKGFSAIRQFVPEVLNFDASFTEKVCMLHLELTPLLPSWRTSV